MTDIVALARRHRHIAATHYEGCEAEHIGCLVEKLAAEVELLHGDAMRYRWLKSRNKVSLLSDGAQWIRPDGSTFVASHSLSADGIRWGVYETLDETIDRAMEDGR